MRVNRIIWLGLLLATHVAAQRSVLRVDKLADLAAAPAFPNNLMVGVSYGVTPGDNLGGIFTLHTSSTAATNSSDVLATSGSGRWLRSDLSRIGPAAGIGNVDTKALLPAFADVQNTDFVAVLSGTTLNPVDNGGALYVRQNWSDYGATNATTIRSTVDTSYVWVLLKELTPDTPVSIANAADTSITSSATNSFLSFANVGGTATWKNLPAGAVDVRWFGALGDFDHGAQTGTDNTITLSNAFNHAFSTNKGHLKLSIPAGSYLFDHLVLADTAEAETHHSNDHITVSGTGIDSTFLIASSTTTNAIWIRGRRVTFENLFLASTTVRSNTVIAGDENGHGIYVSNAAKGTTQGHTELINVRVEGQPNDGVYLRGPELSRIVGCDFQYNGRHGLFSGKSGTPPEVGFVTLVENTRCSFNGDSGYKQTSAAYATLINLEANSNGGTYQAMINGGRNAVLINPDFENQTDSDYVAQLSSTAAFNIDAPTLKFIDTGLDFVAAGFTTNHMLVVSGTANNDGAYDISAVAATELAVTFQTTPTVETEATGTGVTLTATTNNYGLYVAGVNHQILGGHFSGLNAGIVLNIAENCVIQSPHFLNSKHDTTGWAMPWGVLIAGASKDNIIKVDADGYTGVAKTVYDDSTQTAQTGNLINRAGAFEGQHFVPKSIFVTYTNSYTPDATFAHYFDFASLTGDITINKPTGGRNGQYMMMRFQQDATAGRNVTFAGSAYFTDWLNTGNAAASARATITFIYESNADRWMQVSRSPWLAGQAGTGLGERIWIGAEQWFGNEGSPARGVFAARWSAWLMDPATDESIVCNWEKPNHWVGKIRVTLVFGNNTGAAAANAELQLFYNSFLNGDLMNVSGTQLIENVAVTATQYEQDRHTYATDFTLGTGDRTHHFRLYRDADDATNDLFTADVYVLGAFVERVP